MDRTEQAKVQFAADQFATKAAGIEILAADDNYARCQLRVTDIHRNAYGGIMGGALFTLADFAFAVAMNADPDSVVVSVCSQIQYLTFAKGDLLIAETNCLRAGYKSCVTQIDITEPDSTLIARVTINGSRVKLK